VSRPRTCLSATLSKPCTSCKAQKNSLAPCSSTAPRAHRGHEEQWAGKQRQNRVPPASLLLLEAWAPCDATPCYRRGRGRSVGLCRTSVLLRLMPTPGCCCSALDRKGYLHVFKKWTCLVMYSFTNRNPSEACNLEQVTTRMFSPVAKSHGQRSSLSKGDRSIVGLESRLLHKKRRHRPCLATSASARQALMRQSKAQDEAAHHAANATLPNENVTESVLNEHAYCRNTLS
jgi:hypothetical protein